MKTCMALDRRFSVVRTRLLIVWHSAGVTGFVIAHCYAVRADRMAAAPADLAIGNTSFATVDTTLLFEKRAWRSPACSSGQGRTGPLYVSPNST